MTELFPDFLPIFNSPSSSTFLTEFGEICLVTFPDLHLADGINDEIAWSDEQSYTLASASEFKKLAVVEQPVAPLSELFDFDLMILLGPLVPEI